MLVRSPFPSFSLEIFFLFFKRALRRIDYRRCDAAERILPVLSYRMTRLA